jgi:hypothetical protein
MLRIKRKEARGTKQEQIKCERVPLEQTCELPGVRALLRRP